MRMLKKLLCTIIFSFAFVFNAFADDIMPIFYWTATVDGGTVSGVARCGPSSGSTSSSKKNWDSSNWGLQNKGCFCRARDIDSIEWTSIPLAYASSTALQRDYWYGSGGSNSAYPLNSLAECEANCADKCAAFFESNSSYRNNLCGGTCVVNSTTTEYTITYDMDGGTGCSNTTYTDSAVICTPTRDGYTFDGWMDNNTNEIYNGGETVSNINLDLVAFWTINNYTITYNMNGGTGCENTTYTIENYMTLCTPTRDGYEFDGWYDNAEFNGDAITEIPSGSTGNKTYYAKWVSSNAYTCPNGYTSDSVPSQASDCYYNVNAGQYISYSPLNVDASVNGFGQNGNMGYKTIQYETDPLNTITEENTWYFNFSYGALYGDSACRPDNDPYGTWNTVSDTDFPKGNQNNGSVCWCRLNSDNDPGLTGVGYKSKWVARGYVDSGDCWKDCAYDCSQIVGQVYGWSDDIRPSMLNNITLTTSSCPEGYYCPGGRVVFGETGKIACPANSNSSNGAATCTCDSGWATLDGNGATNENPCYATCSLGQYANNGTCVSCPTGYTTTTTHATSISDCVISSQPGTHLVPDADATITGGYTYFKDGEGYSSQSEFASAQSNSWKDFFSYGNLGGRAACSDIWAEYGTVSDVDFDPITWYGKNCWCDIEQYGDCTVDNRTDCSNDNTTTTKSKWVSFGYVENDRCWQDCAGKCANAMEQNATMRTNALSTIVAQSVTCPAGYYCPNTVTVSYGNVTTSKIACPDGTTSPAGATSIDQCVTPSYTITYNLNGGTGCSNTTYTSSDTVTLCTPTRDGYIFNGWYDNSGLTGTAVTEIASGSTGNREYWAKWTALPYTITYNLNDGTNYADAPTSYTVETPTITLGTPTRSGYIFDGWYDNAEFNGDAVTEIASGSTGNREYWAKWTAASYTITYNLNSGTGCSNTTYTSENTVTLCTPTRDGYIFDGWYDNAELTGNTITTISSGSTGNREYWAKWTALPYTITFNTNEGVFPVDVVVPENYTVDSDTISLPVPMLDGYTFNGWYDNAEFNGDAVTEIPSGSIGNKTYYAKWTRNEFVCESGIWLHIGDEDKVCMYETKPDAPTMVVETQNGRYYMMLNENADAPIHDGSNKKMRVEIGNRIYNVHDASVNMK